MPIRSGLKQNQIDDSAGNRNILQLSDTFRSRKTYFWGQPFILVLWWISCQVTHFPLVLDLPTVKINFLLNAFSTFLRQPFPPHLRVKRLAFGASEFLTWFRMPVALMTRHDVVDDVSTTAFVPWQTKVMVLLDVHGAIWLITFTVHTLLDILDISFGTWMMYWYRGPSECDHIFARKLVLCKGNSIWYS